MFKARMKFAKEGRAKYISHLDLMHAMQRSMARCQMPLRACVQSRFTRLPTAA